MTIKEVCEKYSISPDALRYYERVGMIPAVTRTKGGIRDYQEKDLNWLQLALCMRNAGLPVEVITEYRSLVEEGDQTFKARLDLLTKQRTVLLAQKAEIETMLDKLNYKIDKYQTAVDTGVLEWDSPEDKEE